MIRDEGFRRLAMALDADSVLEEQEALYQKYRAAAKKVNDFPKGPMNLTTNEAKNSSEYKQAKALSDRLFQEYRAFNEKNAKRLKEARKSSRP